MTERSSRCTQCLLLVLVVVLIGGCAPPVDPVERALDNYGTRIARLLEVEPFAVGDPQLRLPRLRELTLPITQRRINWVEFAELHQCDLGDLAGYRNSGLGRMQTPIERLRQDQALLVAGRRCLQTIPSAPDWLPELLEEKRRDLTRLSFNAVLAAEEMRDWLGPAPNRSTETAEATLNRLADQLGQDLETLDVAALLDDLALLRTQQPAGPAIGRWQTWADWLVPVAAALSSEATRVCRTRAATPRAKGLRNVFMKYYIGEVQPLLAEEVQVHRPWVEALNRLVRVMPVRSRAFDSWFAEAVSEGHETSAWMRLRSLGLDHAEAWLHLADTCNLSLMARPPR
ncbi:MAG: DUF3080 family protein [Pseudomonadota bacterium]